MNSNASFKPDTEEINKNCTSGKGQIDWMVTFVPLTIIVGLCILFVSFPETSNSILSEVRFFFGDTLGSCYLILGIGVLGISFYLALSKYGNIVLGNRNEKPKYSFFTWGAMMFTAGLAADILFYSMSEWFMYAADHRMQELDNVEEWSAVFPLFHWSMIPWAFYLVLAVAFGFMLHVRKRERQKFSEACRPILGKYTDKWPGRLIDLLAVFALIAGTATTFSVATPLMATLFNTLFGTDFDTTVVTIVILLVTCFIYTYSLLHGFKGISILAKACVYMFYGLMAYVLLFGGETKFIIENGISSLGKMLQNFMELATYTDPQRTSSFPQNWTIYYWAYWMVWCVAAPFFIGNISKGRTIRQTIIGGYVFGVGSTIISFIVLGNYSMGLQLSGGADFIGEYSSTGDAYTIITQIIDTMPLSSAAMSVVFITMLAFYCTSFDSIALTASSYSYRRLRKDEMPNKRIQLLWCILLILLPIALIFAESSMSNLQAVSIISAFPLGIIMIIMIWGLMKDSTKLLNSEYKI